MIAINPLLHLGPAPDRFSEEQAAIWLEIAKLAPPDLLLYSDRWTVEIAATLLYRFRLGDPSRGLEADLREHLIERMMLSPVHAEMLLVKERTSETDAWAAVRSVDVANRRRAGKITSIKGVKNNL